MRSLKRLLFPLTLVILVACGGAHPGAPIGGPTGMEAPQPHDGPLLINESKTRVTGNVDFFIAAGQLKVVGTGTSGAVFSSIRAVKHGNIPSTDIYFGLNAPNLPQIMGIRDGNSFTFQFPPYKPLKDTTFNFITSLTDGVAQPSWLVIERAEDVVMYDASGKLLVPNGEFPMKLTEVSLDHGKLDASRSARYEKDLPISVGPNQRGSALLFEASGEAYNHIEFDLDLSFVGVIHPGDITNLRWVDENGELISNNQGQIPLDNPRASYSFNQITVFNHGTAEARLMFDLGPDADPKAQIQVGFTNIRGVGKTSGVMNQVGNVNGGTLTVH